MVDIQNIVKLTCKKCGKNYKFIGIFLNITNALLNYSCKNGSKRVLEKEGILMKVSKRSYVSSKVPNDAISTCVFREIVSYCVIEIQT